MPKPQLVESPYCYVGTVGRKGLNGWGTGTLVGPSHIVTAAHVLLDAVPSELELAAIEERYPDPITAAASAGSPLVFQLPDGRVAEIVGAELDAGFFPHGFVTYDLAVAKLDNEMGSGGFLPWGVFHDELYGSKLTLLGYDADMRTNGIDPQLVTRTGSVNRTMVTRLDDKRYVVPMFGGGLAAAFIRKSTITGVVGLAAAGGAYALANNHDYQGWESEEFAARAGASGGPLIIDSSQGPLVVGVQSSSRPHSGFAFGSRISSGPAEKMVESYIARP